MSSVMTDEVKMCRYHLKRSMYTLIFNQEIRKMVNIFSNSTVAQMKSDYYHYFTLSLCVERYNALCGY